MEELNNIKSILNRIRLLESSSFEYDEKEIFNKYKKQRENKSSLTIKLLSLFGGFLGALPFIAYLTLMTFFGSLFGSNNEGVLLFIFGIIVIVFAIWLNVKYDKFIIDTFSISIYFTGLIYLALGVLEITNDNNNILFVLCSIAILTLFVTQNYILSFISILLINGCILCLMFFNDLYSYLHLYIGFNVLLLTYLFLNESKLISSNKKISKLYNPSRIGLIISLLTGLVIIGQKNIFPIPLNYIWLSSITISIVLIYLVYNILEIIKIETLKNKIVIYFLTVLVLIPTIFSPSISGAILIILLSFLVNYKTGLALGIISFIYFISQYYYDLNFTLLTKSIILFSSGIVFLLFYVFTIKMTISNEKI